jgi:hypothetical protein
VVLQRLQVVRELGEKGPGLREKRGNRGCDEAPDGSQRA